MLSGSGGGGALVIGRSGANGSEIKLPSWR
jgi:hypothetical protein